MISSDGPESFKEVDLDLDLDLEEDFESHAIYSTNGKGQWFKFIRAKQCNHTVFFSQRCQAVEGHKGYHWYYDALGRYHYDSNKDDLKEDYEINACGTIPPGNKNYIWPGSSKNEHTNFNKWEEITDPAEIERLEAGRFEKHEGVDRPLKETDPYYEEVMRRSKECDEIEKRLRKKNSFLNKVLRLLRIKK